MVVEVEKTKKRGRRRVRVVYIALFILIAVLAGAYWVFKAPTPVRVIRINATSTAETLKVSGRSRGERMANLGLGVTGIVENVAVKEGDTVATGALLLSIDKSAFDSSISAARAAVKSANADLIKSSSRALPSEIRQAQADLELAREVALGRIEKTSGQPEASSENTDVDNDPTVRAAMERLNTLSSLPRREDVNAAQARVEQARSEFRNAMATREKADLRAPFSGVVSMINASQGQSVSPGQNLIELQEMTKPIIEADVRVNDIGKLFAGEQAVVSSDAFPGQSFRAVVKDLGFRVNPDRETVSIKLQPLRKVHWIRPNLLVQVNIAIGRSEPRVRVPRDAVTRHNGRYEVRIAESGRSVPVRVIVGAKTSRSVVIFGDLSDGDLVIRNTSKIKAHQRIRILR